MSDKERHDLVREYEELFDEFSRALEGSDDEYVKILSDSGEKLDAKAFTYSGMYGLPAKAVPLVQAPLDSWDDEYKKRLRHTIEESISGLANIQDDLVELINNAFLPHPKQGPIVWELRRRFSIEMARLRRIKAMVTPGMPESEEGSYDERIRDLRQTSSPAS